MKGRPPGKLDLTFNRRSRDLTNTETLILYGRRLIQNNDDASIGNLAKLYDEMPIHTDFKMDFCYYRGYLNQCLISVQSCCKGQTDSTRRTTCFYLRTICTQCQRWYRAARFMEEQPPDWDIAYYLLEETLHEFIEMVNTIKELNETVLNHAG